MYYIYGTEMDWEPTGKGKIITLVGGISHGKTTLGLMLEKYLREQGHEVSFHPEPRDQTKLEEYCRDMKRYGTSFQMFMLEERIKIYKTAIEEAKKGIVSIIDGCLICDHAFAQLQLEAGNMLPIEHNMYLDRIRSECFPRPDAVIYLEADPEISFTRMIKRGTDPKGYTPEYFKLLHRIYSDTIRKLEPEIFLLKTKMMDRSMESKIPITDRDLALLWLRVEMI